MTNYADPWYLYANEHSPVLCSSVRLLRNIDGLPYPVRLNATKKAAVNNKLCDILLDSFPDFVRIDMNRLYPYEAVALAEKHLITPEFASALEGRVLLLSPDERVSVMLNEEDHLHIQAIESGLTPEQTLKQAQKIENSLQRDIHFAFDEKLGYLNQNPLNIGTGLKASVLLHLPALAGNNRMPAIASMLSKLGFSVRGAYGNTLAVKGDIYRVENPICMGLSENQTVTNLKTVVQQLATEERNTAENYTADPQIQQKIEDAEQALLTKQSLSSDEMTELLSFLRLGVISKQLSYRMSAVNALFITMQPAHLNCMAGGRLTREARDMLRAKAVQKELSLARL